ncbi:hypothetical protein V5799_026607, partial [Amblyomma americanum]
MALLLRRNLLPRLVNLHKVTRTCIAPISTSKNNKEVPAATVPDAIGKPPVTAADFADTKPRYWISYGYCEKDYNMDRDLHHVIMFTVITLVFCGCTFAVMYAPDF